LFQVDLHMFRILDQPEHPPDLSALGDLDAGCWMLDAGYWILAKTYRTSQNAHRVSHILPG